MLIFVIQLYVFDCIDMYWEKKKKKKMCDSGIKKHTKAKCLNNYMNSTNPDLRVYLWYLIMIFDYKALYKLTLYI